MLTRNQIKLIKSLGRKRGRHEHGLFVAEGRKLVQEALESKWKVEAVYCLPHLSEEKPFSDHNPTVISSSEMERITQLNTPSEALAIVKLPENYQLQEFSGRWLILDGINDPGNLGTMIRIADWFGWRGILCSNDTVDRFNPKVVQATMGSLFRVPVFYDDLDHHFAGGNFRLFGAYMDGSNMWETGDPGEHFGLVIGSEAHGIRPALEKKITDRISIPGQGDAESLNAAVAAGILVAALSR